MLFYRINSLTTYPPKGKNKPAECAESLLPSYQWTGGCMLTQKTYTPSLEAEAAPIFATLPDPLAAQLVREMIRLNSEKVDSGQGSNVLLQPSQHHATAGPPARHPGRILRQHLVCAIKRSLPQARSGNPRR